MFICQVYGASNLGESRTYLGHNDFRQVAIWLNKHVNPEIGARAWL